MPWGIGVVLYPVWNMHAYIEIVVTMRTRVRRQAYMYQEPWLKRATY